MKRIIGLVAGCALTAAALVTYLQPVRAQTPPLVTITFRLTLTGTVPAHDSFAVTWAENGIELCSGSCAGGGHLYTATMPWPKGSAPITFVFDRFNPATGHQKFGSQTVTPAANRNVSAFFTYGNAATVPTPATGGAPPIALGAGVVTAGGATALLAARMRCQANRPRRPR